MNKKRIIKTCLTILIIVLLIIVSFYVYAFIISKAMQRKPLLDIPNELQKIEKKIQVETKSVYSGFEQIEKNKLEKCEALINLRLYLENDSIDEKNIDKYLNEINFRVNNALIKKECLDSLIIKYSLHNKRNKEGKLIFLQKSFPIK